MIGILIIAHGNLGHEFLATLEQIHGKQDQIETVGIAVGDDMDKKRQQIIAKIKELNTGSGVIVLTDMFGGTPSNLAISVIEKSPVEVLAGVNLPMLIKIVSVRKSGDLKKTALEAQEAGRRYIHIASQILTTGT